MPPEDQSSPLDLSKYGAVPASPAAPKPKPVDFAKYGAVPVQEAAALDLSKYGAVPVPAGIPGMEKLGGVPPGPANDPNIGAGIIQEKRLFEVMPTPAVRPRSPIEMSMGGMAGAAGAPAGTPGPTAEGLVKIGGGAMDVLRNLSPNAAAFSPSAGVGQSFPQQNTRKAAQGAADVISGGFEVAGPLAGPALAAAPVSTLAAIGLGSLADVATTKGMKALGVPDEYANLGGAVAALLAGGKWGREALAKVHKSLGSPEVKIGGKFEEPKPFRDMADEELIAHANKIEAEPPKNYNWQKEQIVQEAARRQAGRGMPAPGESAATESPIEGGSLYKYTKRVAKSKPVPEAQTPAVVPPQSLTSETSTPQQEVAVAPPTEALAPTVAEPPDGGAASNKELISPSLGSTAVMPSASPLESAVGSAVTESTQGGEGESKKPHYQESPSFIVTDKATGKAVMETFEKKTAAAINREKYDVVPAGEYLAKLNGPKQNAVVPVNPPSIPEEARGTGQKQNTEAVAPEQKPSLGETGREIYQGWKSLGEGPQPPRGVIVGKVVGGGDYSFRDGKIVREFREKGRHGTISTYREATDAEITDIHDAISKGAFQVEQREISGAGGVYARPTGGSVQRLIHQSTGRPLNEFLETDEGKAWHARVFGPRPTAQPVEAKPPDGGAQPTPKIAPPNPLKLAAAKNTLKAAERKAKLTRKAPDTSALAAELETLRAENERLKAPKAQAAANHAPTLRRLAEGMQRQIDEKNIPAFANQNVTARRARLAAGKAGDAERLERIQKGLSTLADMHEAGNIPDVLKGIRTRGVFESVMPRYDEQGKRVEARFHGASLTQPDVRELLEKSKGASGTAEGRKILERRQYSSEVSYFSEGEIPAIEKVMDAAVKRGYKDTWTRERITGPKRLYAAGINERNFKEAQDAIAELGVKKRERTKEEKVREAERELIGSRIEGYFPTPKPLAARLVKEAGIKPGMSVLEPSAGNGAIADEVAATGAKVTAIEPVDRLRGILELKGHAVEEGRDFLEHRGKYDRIVMNPPFERGQDMDHVRHAFDSLNPGGRVVAIMSEGSFSRSDKKATEFREWLEERGGTSEKLPEGSFTGKEAQRQTGVATRMVAIEKDASLQARPIEGPTYRPTMPRAQKVATASLQPMRVGRERNPVLSANAQVMDLLHEALGIPDTDIPGATFTAPQVEEILRKVSQERRTSLLKGNKEAAAKWGELRDAIEQNRAMVKGGPMVVYAEKSALSEELNHATQLKATGDQYLNHLGVEGTRSFLAANSLGERAATNLMSRYGYSENAPAMVLEIGARLMEPGRYKEMGLSLDEANTLRDQYERLLIERHGVERISKISERLNSARKKDNGVQYERGITTRANQGGRDGRPPGTLGRSAVQDARRAEGEGNGSPAGGKGGLPPVRGDKALQGRLPERRGTEPLQSRSEGPRFKKQESRVKQAADVPKSVRERIKQEGPAGVEVMRKIDRADTIGTISAGKRVATFSESGIEDLTRDERFTVVDALEGRSKPTGKVAETAEVIRGLLDVTAREAEKSHVATKRQATIRPEDPVPAGAKLTDFQKKQRELGKRVFVTYKKPFQARSSYYPHVIPSTDALAKGKIREDVIDAMVRRGEVDTQEAAEGLVDLYRKFVDEGGRATKLEEHLINTGRARDASEARALMARFRKKAIKRQGSIEASRVVDLPFYDPDPLRVLPHWLASASMRLAEIREFGQDNEALNKLIHRIEAANGNHAFVRAAVERGLKMIRDGDTGDEQVARFITTLNGFRLSLSFIQNSTQGVLNTLLHTHDPILTGKAFAGSFTKEGRKFAARSGTSLEGMINEMVRSVGRDDSALGNALEKYLSVTFTPSEKQNRITAAIAGKLWAEKMLRRLKINPKDELARQELAAMGLTKADVLLKIGKVDGDAALVAGKSFSDLTQFRSRVWDMMNFSTKSSLGRMMSQFKNYGYQQFRLAYRDSIGEIRKGRWGRGAATILILAAVFPMAGEVVADIRSLISGRKRPTRALDRYLEDIAAGSALGIVADTLQGGMARRGAETIGGPPVSVGGQALDTLASFRGDRAVTEKLKGFGKGITKLVLGFFGGAGTAISNRVLFPPREAQSSDSRKLNRKLRKLK